jgi:large subunit ribosomal protein L30
MNEQSGASATIRVRQIKSGIGFDIGQKRTLKAMGLGRIGKVRTMPDNQQVRGMIRKVTHLVVVEDTAGN